MLWGEVLLAKDSAPGPGPSIKPVQGQLCTNGSQGVVPLTHQSCIPWQKRAQTSAQHLSISALSTGSSPQPTCALSRLTRGMSGVKSWHILSKENATKTSKPMILRWHDMTLFYWFYGQLPCHTLCCYVFPWYLCARMRSAHVCTIQPPRKYSETV